MAECDASSPADDVLEVTVFGRGMGEAILAHVGGGRWIAVDSCLGEDGERPATIGYLERLDIDPAVALRLVAVSHWDADHVGGLAQLVRAAPGAVLACASTLQDPRLVYAIRKSGRPAVSEGRKRSVDQFAAVFDTITRRRQPVAWGLPGTVLWEDPDVRVWSLSPSSRIYTKSLTRLIENAPRGNEVRTDRGNYLSMVAWVEAGERRVLLGGDLERKPGRPWDDVMVSPGPRGARGEAYKVAHHGSQSGDHPRLWANMLVPNVPAAATAFTRRHLPTTADRARLRGSTGRAYLAGDAVDEPPKSPERKMLERMGSPSGGPRPLAGRLGWIRMRAKLDGSGDWDICCQGNALAL